MIHLASHIMTIHQRLQAAGLDPSEETVVGMHVAAMSAIANGASEDDFVWAARDTYQRSRASLKAELEGQGADSELSS